MAIFRVQASDFQDGKSITENLGKLEKLAKFTNFLIEEKHVVAGVDLLGDFMDAHNLKQFILEMSQTIWFEYMLKNYGKEEHYPEVDEYIKRRIKNPMDLLRMSLRELNDEERQEFNSLKERYPDIINARFPSLEDTIRSYYAQENNILGKIKTSLFGVRGNNDTNFIQDVMTKVKFTDLEDSVTSNKTEDYEFTIIGANNTNDKKEIIPIYQKLNLNFPTDDAMDITKSTAYQKFNIKRTKIPADIIQLHGPPNDVGMRTDRMGKKSTMMSVGVAKLIKEHRPKVVQCGHYHTARIWTDENGVTYVRSSPDVYFVLCFDEKTKDFLYAKPYAYDDKAKFSTKELKQ